MILEYILEASKSSMLMTYLLSVLITPMVWGLSALYVKFSKHDFSLMPVVSTTPQKICLAALVVCASSGMGVVYLAAVELSYSPIELLAHVVLLVLFNLYCSHKIIDSIALRREEEFLNAMTGDMA